MEIRGPGNRPPQHQILLALATKAIDAQDESRFLRRQLNRQRTPPRWQKIHAGVDRARAALARIS